MEIAKFENVEMPLVNHGGQIWMTAESIGQALEYNEPRISVMRMFNRKRDELEDFSAVVNLTTEAGQRETTVFNEEGVMMLTMFSKQPKAKDFRKWAVGILKAYRSGELTPAVNPAELSRMDLIQIAMDAEKERLVLEGKVEALTPKAEALDRIAFAEGNLVPTDAAKTLQLPPRKFMQWLTHNRWIYKRAGGRHNVAYQDKIQAGYLTHKVKTILLDDGSERVCEQVMVTPKGLAKLAHIFETMQPLAI